MATLSRPVKRIVVLLLGWMLIGLGVIGLFVPILQGILLIMAGLYLLSRESAMARRQLERLRRRYPTLDARLTAWLERKQKQAPSS